MKKCFYIMETFLIIVAWFAIALILWQLFSFSTTIKKSKNERTPPNKKEQKLLRFQRGNKTLTPAQQERLDKLSQYHERILKQIWKDEHL